MSFQPLSEKLIAFIKEGQELNNCIPSSLTGNFIGVFAGLKKN